MAEQRASASKESPNGDSSSGAFGFFWRIFSALTGGEDPDRGNKRKLKEIAKTLKRQKYKFYKPKTGEVLPALGRFFYEIYHVVAPAQLLIERASDSAVLKSIVIESFLSDDQKELREKFEEEVIRARSEEVPSKELGGEYKDMLIRFFSSFDKGTVGKINSTYNLLQIFLWFVHFDYYFLIKKFDSRFPENDFKYRPQLDAINGEYVSDDIKDFLDIAPLVKPDVDWEGLFSILQVYKGTTIVPEKGWRQILRSVSEVTKSHILELIVAHIDSNPGYSPAPQPPNNKIVDEYLSKIKNQTEITIQKILNERRKNKIDSLAKAVFGTAAVSRTRNYTDKANLTFSKKMLGGFTYVVPLNYLKAFLLDYVKGDIKQVVDTLLIRGQWSTTIMSQQLSESFHQLVNLTDQLLEFDDSLSEEGERGAAIKKAIHKSDRDKSMIRVLKQYLSNANKEALRIITESAQNLVAVAKYLKQVLEDHKRKPPEVIVNWKEIESAFENDVNEEIARLYKQIYYFTQLLQYYVKKS